MNNDLISRSELIKAINENVLGASTFACEIRQDVIDMIKAQPIATNIDKIKEQLKNEIDKEPFEAAVLNIGYQAGIEKALNIIEEGGV